MVFGGLFVERLRQIVAARKERSGVAVFTHAKHDNIQAPAPPPAASFRNERHKARGLGMVLQQALFDQSRIGTRAVFIDLAFVHQCHRDLFPSDVLTRKMLKKQCGRGATRDRKRGRPLREMARDRPRATRSAKASAKASRFSNHCGFNHEADSCQVLPSRSIKATDAAGPQVPDV